jgi:hypothetical protein
MTTNDKKKKSSPPTPSKVNTNESKGGPPKLSVTKQGGSDPGKPGKSSSSKPKVTQAKKKDATKHKVKLTNGLPDTSSGGAFHTPSMRGWNDDKSLALLKEFRSRNSSYLHTLLDPWSNIGIGVPCDALATVKLSCTRRIQFAVDSNGNAFFTWGFGIDSLNAGTVDTADYAVNNCFLGPWHSERELWDDSIATFIPGFSSNPQGQYTTGTSDLQSGNWFEFTVDGSMHASRASWDFPTATKQFLWDNFTALRVVSAGVTFNTTASALDNKGLFTVASVPRGFIDPQKPLGTRASYTGAVPSSEFLDLETEVTTWPNSIVIPLNKGVGGTSLYFPYDPPTRTFATLGLQDDTNLEEQQFFPRDIPTEFRPGFMAAVVSGAEPATVIIADVIINLEGLPITNALLQTTASNNLEDEMELTHVEDQLELAAPCFAGSELSTHNGVLGPTSDQVLSGFDPTRHRRITNHLTIHNGWQFRDHDHKLMVNGPNKIPGPGLGKSKFWKKAKSVMREVEPTVRMIDKVLTHLTPILATIV